MGRQEGRAWLLLSPPDPDRRGYRLCELLNALSILRQALAVVLPNGMRALDRMVLHSVLFEFQNSLGQARNRAFLAEADVELAPDGGMLVEALQNRPGCSASADRTMFIRSDGSCLKDGRRFREQQQRVGFARRLNEAADFRQPTSCFDILGRRGGRRRRGQLSLELVG